MPGKADTMLPNFPYWFWTGTNTPATGYSARTPPNSGYYDPKLAAVSNQLQQADNRAAWSEAQAIDRAQAQVGNVAPTEVTAPQVANATTAGLTVAAGGGGGPQGSQPAWVNPAATNPNTGAPLAGFYVPPLSTSYRMPAGRWLNTGPQRMRG